MTTIKTFNVTGMHCASCGLLIDDVLEDLQCVRKSQTDSKRGTTEVEFEESEPTVTEIVNAIESLGYAVKETQ